MAINKKNQKMFYFSSDYVKKFVETRIDDVAIETPHKIVYKDCFDLVNVCWGVISAKKLSCKKYTL